MVKKIELSQNQVTEVDDKDYDWLMKHKWYALKRKQKDDVFVACRKEYLGVIDGKKKWKSIYMHREIMERILMDERMLDKLEKFLQNPPKYPVDHINGNPLTNTRDNLRIVSPRENQQNRHRNKSSKYPGVTWHKRKRKWYVQIEVNGESMYLGSFKKEEDGAQSYIDKCNELGLPCPINDIGVN